MPAPSQQFSSPFDRLRPHLRSDILLPTAIAAGGVAQLIYSTVSYVEILTQDGRTDDPLTQHALTLSLFTENASAALVWFGVAGLVYFSARIYKTLKRRHT